MYYAQAILTAACFSVFLKGQSFKKPWYLFMAIILPLAVIIKFSVHNIFNIFPDTIMALIAVSLFAIYYTSEKKYSDILKLIPIIFALCLIRVNAVGFVICVLLLIGADLFSLKDLSRKKVWRNMATLILPIIISLSSWQLHLKIINAIDKSSNAFPLDADRLTLTISNFIKALYTNGLGNVNPFMSWFYLMSTTLFLCFLAVVMIGIILLILRRGRMLKSFLRYNIMFLVCFILYCCALIASYQFSFTRGEAIALASFNRYMSTYFIFWIIGIFYMMITMLAKNDYIDKTQKIMISTLSLILIFAVIGLSHPVKLNIIGSRRLENVYTDEAIICADEIHNAIGYDASVYLVFQKSSGYTFMAARYQLGTNRANLGTWSMGKPYSETDVFTVDRTPEEFIKVLDEIEYEYVYLGYADDAFWNIYGKLFEKPNEGYKIYEFTPNGAFPLTVVK